jgi:UDP-N-acetylglucosamine transferase subunit ALG13
MAANVGNLPQGDLSWRHLLIEGYTLKEGTVSKQMIFITLGSQKFQFNRLLKAIDDLIESGIVTDEVFAQSGYSDYKPQNYQFKQFLDRDEFAECEARADIVITHGGTGAIIGAVKKGKKVIAVPRLAKYGEHVDNHQLQLITQFKNQNLICGLDDCRELEEALRYVKNHEFDCYQSNTQSIIESIERFIEK